jgi:hypothetical protein
LSFDDRFGLRLKDTFHGAGGQSCHRTIATEMADFKFLCRHFGEAVQKKTKPKSRGSMTHEWERMVVLPF